MDGPGLIIEWRDKKNGLGWLVSHYYPDKNTKMVDAELSCFEWFKKRGNEIRSMTWAWGPISPFVTRRNRLVLG